MQPPAFKSPLYTFYMLLSLAFFVAILRNTLWLSVKRTSYLKKVYLCSGLSDLTTTVKLQMEASFFFVARHGEWGSILFKSKALNTEWLRLMFCCFEMRFMQFITYRYQLDVLTPNSRSFVDVQKIEPLQSIFSWIMINVFGFSFSYSWLFMSDKAFSMASADCMLSTRIKSCTFATRRFQESKCCSRVRSIIFWILCTSQTSPKSLINNIYLMWHLHLLPKLISSYFTTPYDNSSRL